jgi:hypothetical protein
MNVKREQRIRVFCAEYWPGDRYFQHPSECQTAIASRLTPTLALRPTQHLCPAQSPCGSELARESGSTFNIDGGWHTAFAGKPAPTIVRFSDKLRVRHQAPVGASLLAKAVLHSTLMLAGTPSSRASPLPQLSGLATNCGFDTKPLWERACSRKRFHIQH